MSLGVLAGLFVLALFSPLAVRNLPGTVPTGTPGSSIPADEIVYALYREGDMQDGVWGTIAIRAADGRTLGRVPEALEPPIINYQPLLFSPDGRVFGFHRPGDGPEVRFVEFDPSLNRVRRVLYREPRGRKLDVLVSAFSRYTHSTRSNPVEPPLVGNNLYLRRWRGSVGNVFALDVSTGEVSNEVELDRAFSTWATALVPRRNGEGGKGDTASILVWGEAADTDWMFIEIDSATGRTLSRATFDFDDPAGCYTYLLPATLRDGRVWGEVFCVTDWDLDFLRELDLSRQEVIREVDLLLGCGDGGYLSCQWDQTLALGPGGRRLFRVGFDSVNSRVHILRVDLDTGARDERISPLPHRAQDSSAHGQTLKRILATVFPSREARASGIGPPDARGIISPDGSLLYTSYQYGYDNEADGILVFSTETLELVADFPLRSVEHRFNLSPDGRRLYALVSSGRIVVADAITGQVLRELSVPPGFHLYGFITVGRAKTDSALWRPALPILGGYS